MKVWIYAFTFAVSISSVLSQSCPSESFSATFVATSDVIVDGNPFLILGPNDPELNFLKEVMQFREEAIQHTIEDVMRFFNDFYGLDFSASTPNEQNERFFQNATMGPFVLSEEANYVVTTNNWIRNGNTRSTCYKIHDGGFRVSFSADQTLYGSYGGAQGKPAGVNEVLVYGFYNIDVCQQSPVIIQYQSGSPFRAEPVDGTFVINCDLYNRVLGHGKAQGITSIEPVQNEPGKYRFTIRNAFTFPAM